MGKDVDQAIHSCVGTLDNIPQRMIHSFFYSMLNYSFFDRNESFGFAVGLAMYSDVFIKMVPELANVLPSSPADIPDKRTILCGALNPRLEKILRAENVGPIKAQLVLAILFINLLDEVNTKEKVLESKEYRKLQILYHYLFVEIIEY